MKCHPVYKHLWINEIGEVWTSLINKGIHGWADSGSPHKILKPGINNAGYYYVVVHRYGKKKKVYIHKLVQDVYFPNIKMLDHIDRNRLNNRNDNFRPTTVSKNSMNVACSSNTGHLGISYDKAGKRWRSMFQFNNKLISLGFTKDESQVPALAAHRERVVQHYIDHNNLPENWRYQ